jgi:hypothetical protein
VADEAPDEATARAALRGKRVALGIVIVAAVAFILATASRVIPSVFGLGSVPLAPGPCADGLRGLEAAFDRDDGGSHPPKRDQIAVEEVCAKTPQGLDAWASFERLRLAREELEGRDPAALGRLKRDLAAHLPSDLR